jgi:hypothetical protein
MPRRAPENEQDRVHQIAAQLPGQARIVAEKILALLSKPKKNSAGLLPSKKAKLRPQVALSAIASGNISSLEALLAQLEAEEEEESNAEEMMAKLMVPAVQPRPVPVFSRALRPAPVASRPSPREARRKLNLVPTTSAPRARLARAEFSTPFRSLGQRASQQRSNVLTPMAAAHPAASARSFGGRAAPAAAAPAGPR